MLIHTRLQIFESKPQTTLLSQVSLFRKFLKYLIDDKPTSYVIPSMRNILVSQPQSSLQQAGFVVGSSSNAPIQAQGNNLESSSLKEIEENQALATGLVNCYNAFAAR